MANKKEKKDVRVLIVEDNEKAGRLLVSILSKIYDRIIIAKDGEDALLLLNDFHMENKPFDVIVSDINMPRLHGLDLLNSVRKVDKDLPFIFVTAQKDEKLISKAQELGVDEYLFKPIDALSLIDTIDKVLNKNR